MSACFKLSQKEINNAESNIEQWIPFIKGEATVGGQVDEDLFQTLMLGVLEAEDNYDQSKGAYSTWLYYRLKSVKADYYDDNKEIDTVDKDINDFYNLFIDTNIENNYMEETIEEEIDKCIEMLKPSYRNMIKQRFFENKNVLFVLEIYPLYLNMALYSPSSNKISIKQVSNLAFQ